MTKTQLKVLFVCTGNSCRSQMAEGLINHDFKNQIVAISAGVSPCYVHPNAIMALDEIGIDITHHKSEHVNDYADEKFDIVITLCDHAKSQCPTFTNTSEIIHMPFDDPINATGSDEEILNEYRRVRDLLRIQIGDFLTRKIKNKTKKQVIMDIGFIFIPVFIKMRGTET